MSFAYGNRDAALLMRHPGFCHIVKLAIKRSARVELRNLPMRKEQRNNYDEICRKSPRSARE